MATPPQLSLAVTEAIQSVVQTLHAATPIEQQTLDVSAQAIEEIMCALVGAVAVATRCPLQSVNEQPVPAAAPVNEPQVQPVCAAAPVNEPQVQPVCAEPTTVPQLQPVCAAAPSTVPQLQPVVCAAAPVNEPQVQPVCAEPTTVPQLHPVCAAEQPGNQPRLLPGEVQFYPPMDMSMDDVEMLMARIDNVRKGWRTLRGGKPWKVNTFLHCNVLILYATMLMTALGVLLPRGVVDQSVRKTLKQVKQRGALIGMTTRSMSTLNSSTRKAWKEVRRRRGGYITEDNIKGLNVAVVKPLADYLLHVFDHIELFTLHARINVSDVQALAARLHFHEKPKTLRLAKISPVPPTGLHAVRTAHGALWRLWKTAPVIDVDRSDYFVAATEYLAVLRAYILGVLSAGVTSKKVSARLMELKALNNDTPTRTLETLAKRLDDAPCTALAVCHHFDVVHRVALRLRQTCRLGGEEVDFCGLFALIQPS
jgi:hypothetical protein